MRPFATDLGGAAPSAWHMTGRSPEVDALIEATPDGRGALLAELRELVQAADPEIEEVVKWRKPSNPHGVAVFEHDGIVCLLIPLKGRVRLVFAEGAELPDPKRLFNAQRNGYSRGIDVPVGSKIDAAGVKALVRAAVRRRTSNRSRASSTLSLRTGAAQNARRHRKS